MKKINRCLMKEITIKDNIFVAHLIINEILVVDLKNILYNKINITAHFINIINFYNICFS